jgi:hypothetical protein
VALLAGAAVAVAGCGGHHPRPAALRLERADLVLVAHTLAGVQAVAHGEVAAARVVWPALARGLPAGLSPGQRLALAAAERRAAALALPWYVTTEEGGGLTGPAAAVGGLLKAYASLAPRGWRFIAAALAPQAATASGGEGASSGRTAATARFERANAGLYVYCVYDGHYDLSLIGKTFSDGYRRLGGPAAFGAALTAGQVAALARAYSIPAVRLQPHPPAGLGV